MPLFRHTIILLAALLVCSTSVWGVNFEDTDAELVREFVADLGVSYPILGLGQDPLTGYDRVRFLPTTFVIDPQGRFLHRFEGPITSQDIVDIIES